MAFKQVLQINKIPLKREIFCEIVKVSVKAKVFMTNQKQDDLFFEGKSIDFKPINQGLGFHQEPDVRHPMRKRQATKSKTPSRAGDLTRRLLENADVQVAKKVVVADLIVASYMRRLLAWVIDLTLIASLVLLTLLVFQRFSGVSAAKIISVLGSEHSVYALGSIFSVYYLFYFSILDYSFTPGKYFARIRLTGSINLKRTFMRAFVTLTNGLLLFFPILFRWEDKITETTIRKV